MSLNKHKYILCRTLAPVRRGLKPTLYCKWLSAKTTGLALAPNACTHAVSTYSQTADIPRLVLCGMFPRWSPANTDSSGNSSMLFMVRLSPAQLNSALLCTYASIIAAEKTNLTAHSCLSDNLDRSRVA